MKDNPSLFYFGARQFVIAVGGEDSDSSCRNEKCRYNIFCFFSTFVVVVLIISLIVVSFDPLIMNKDDSQKND
jgi:hypothetical protein